VIELIINAPHTQTKRQRLAAMTLHLFGWLLWSYFLFPLVALGCSFFEFLQCPQWVGMPGGRQYLQEMLLNYLETVAAIVLVWAAWVAYNLAPIRSRPKAPPLSPIGPRELSKTFNVAGNVLNECQDSRFIVVHFDENGNIIGLENHRQSN